MSAPGTTPGPWQVAGTRHSGDLKLGRDARLHAVGPDNDAVTMVFFDMATGKGLADAHLIAAAPCMFEALAKAKVLIGARNDTLTEAARQSNIAEAWHILDAALAKASPSARLLECGE